MAVEDMRSDHPNSEPARIGQLAPDARKDIGVPVRRDDASTAIGVNLHGPRDPDRRLRAQR